MTGGRRPAGDVRAGRSPAHGFCDDEATRRLLRSRPPRQALAWAAARLGGPVISARALRGGMSSAVHLLTVQDSREQRRQAVLRRYVRPELNAEEPDIAEREARALRAARAAGVPTPALLAIDPAGTEAGVPAVLMSRLPGQVDWWPSDMDRWLRGLAGLLPCIHAAPLPPPGALPRFAPYPQASYQPPGWARYPAVWERAAEISYEPAPRLPTVLLHRDYHPGNVLWRRGAVSGVVDWQAACTGPAVAAAGAMTAHRGRDITVECEAVARLIIAGFHDLAGQVSGEVDLEPVPRECVMSQHDIAIAGSADIHVAAEAQNPVALRGKHPHLVLIGVKVEVADRPGRHLPIIHDAASPARKPGQQ